MNTKLTSLLAHIHGPTRHDPLRDWLIMTGLFVFALLTIIIWEVWTFSIVEGGETSGVVTASSTPPLNRAAIDSVTKLFEARAVEEEKYKSGGYHFNDPSL